VDLDPAQSALLVIDVQSGLRPFIHESGRVVDRIAFIVELGRLLEVPIFVTEQNPSKMGTTTTDLDAALGETARFPKMEFSAARCPAFIEALRASGRRQIVVVGLETHICVGLTAQDLLAEGFEVAVCPDAVSSRSLERHKLGMERIRDAGAVPSHTESVTYEWMGSAVHPRFRDALAIVKRHP
jgi:nicotinamidase-related amidase